MLPLGDLHRDPFARAAGERLNYCEKKIEKLEARRASIEAEIAYYKKEQLRTTEDLDRFYETGAITDRIAWTGRKERTKRLSDAKASLKNGRERQADQKKLWKLCVALAGTGDWTATSMVRQGHEIIVSVRAESAVGNRLEELASDIRDKFYAAIDLLLDLWVSNNRHGANNPSAIYTIRHLDQLRGVERDHTPEVTDARIHDPGWMPGQMPSGP